MPDLNYTIEGAEPQRFAAAPLLLFKLHLRRGPPDGMLADADPRRRPALPGADRAGAASLHDAEKDRLLDLFGTPERWGRRCGPCSGRTSTRPSRVRRHCNVDLPVPCSFDFSLAATKYFAALEEGDIPFCFLFSGTIFYEAPTAPCRWRRSPGRRRRTFRLPGGDLAGMMDLHYPNIAWLCLRKDVFDRLDRFQSRSGLPDLGAAPGAAARRGRGAGDAMNRAIVDPIADAVLYEGYILYPYRPSIKNRQRWTFGGLYPRPTARRNAGDASGNQTECLSTDAETTFEAVVRFLH